MHYELRRSAFANQMCSCNSVGACYVTNSAASSFVGTVTLRLLNVKSGRSVAMSNQSVSLPPGAGVTHWFCPGGKKQRAGAAMAAADHRNNSQAFIRHYGQLPSNREDYYQSVERRATNVTAECESICLANTSCTGFTKDNQLSSRCWLYGRGSRSF